MTKQLPSLYTDICRHARETALLHTAEGVLEWDERTMLPPAGGEYRAEQLALLAGLIHRRWTDPALVDKLSEAAAQVESDDESDLAVNIRRLKRRVDKKLKLPQQLVEELARTTARGQQVWQKARQESDFSQFQPALERIVALKQQEADALGYDSDRYDALLDDYEPEERTPRVRQVLSDLRASLVPLVAAIADSTRKPRSELLRGRFPIASQQAFGRLVSERIGFDFECGRLDVTTHPFCTSLGPRDCRITTRYYEDFLSAALFGILHEAGHGIYDQGLPAEWYGLPRGEAVSLGIHESQSRLWENLVGRSRAFWRHFLPRAQEVFAPVLSEVSLDEFVFAINEVRPSLIRVEADEATYNLHILVRFELEHALLGGDLNVADLPGAWNEKYREYLGIVPGNDAEGVLQDVHWSAGLIGYFPTYALGNLYAAQFFERANKDLGCQEEAFARGEFTPLREWLRENIHSTGQRFSAAELVERVTGKPLSSAPLLSHLQRRFGPLYGLRSVADGGV
ncbi:MAG: carboxypeptidase M32 [Planctomycetota bacterium]